MHEILFRGKQKNGRWAEGSLITAPKYCCIFEKTDEGEWDPTFLDGDIGTFDGQATPIIPDTIGQYTGLTDKYGKKIFEGDIIKTDNGRISAISVVQYGKFEPKLFYDLLERFVRPRPEEKIYGLFAKSARGEEMFLSECSYLIEVIGNIHDNPELLEGSGDNG